MHAPYHLIELGHATRETGVCIESLRAFGRSFLGNLSAAIPLVSSQIEAKQGGHHGSLIIVPDAVARELGY